MFSEAEEIGLEAIHFLDRSALERLQMHSRYLRNFVNRHARSLPLRYIHHVQFMYGDVLIALKEDDLSVPRAAGPPRRRTPDELELEALFHRLNNAFIHRLMLRFDSEDIRVPNYLRSNSADLQCTIRVLDIYQSTVAIDYALAEFLGVHLKPQIYEMSVQSESLEEGYAMLFTHNGLRCSVAHLAYMLDGPVPDSIIPKLFGFGVVETCSMGTLVDPRLWIGKFVEMFERAERGADIVRSVTLLHMRYGEASPLRHIVELLGEPRSIDVPTPRMNFVKQWSCLEQYLYETIPTESPVAELYEIENAKTAKRLEVLVWTIEQALEGEPSLHYVYLFQVVGM